jgi:hypothetical protein
MAQLEESRTRRSEPRGRYQEKEVPIKGPTMSISLIGKSIGESATLKLNETAAILRAKGEPVIHLGGGEPKTKDPCP